MGANKRSKAASVPAAEKPIKSGALLRRVQLDSYPVEFFSESLAITTLAFSTGSKSCLGIGEI